MQVASPFPFFEIRQRDPLCPQVVRDLSPQNFILSESRSGGPEKSDVTDDPIHDVPVAKLRDNGVERAKNFSEGEVEPRSKTINVARAVLQGSRAMILQTHEPDACCCTSGRREGLCWECAPHAD